MSVDGIKELYNKVEEIFIYHSAQCKNIQLTIKLMPPVSGLTWNGMENDKDVI